VDSLRAQMDCVENEIFTVRQGHHSKFEALATEEKQLADAVAAVEVCLLYIYIYNLIKFEALLLPKNSSLPMLWMA
jgi:hypothetical protein